MVSSLKAYFRRTWAVWLVGGSAFLLYILSLPRHVFFGDNGQFLVAASTFGVPHPPGFPLFVGLSWLAGQIPFGVFPLKINLLAALAGSAVSVAVFMLIRRAGSAMTAPEEISPKIFSAIAAVTALLLAASDIFWQYSTTAKPLTLNVFLILFAVWFVVRYWETGEEKFICAAAAVSGLGLANHPTFLLALPVLALAPEFKRAIPNRVIAKSMACFLFPLLLYFLLPIRSAAQPALDWNQIGWSWDRFIQHVSRGDYQDFGFSGFSWNEKAFFIRDAANTIWAQFGALLAFALAGVYALIRRARRWLWILLGLPAVNIFGLIFFRSVAYGEYAAYLYRQYYLPAFAALAILIGLGAIYVASIANRRKFLGGRAWAIPVVLLLAAVAMVWVNWPWRNISSSDWLENYTTAILENLPPGSVYVLSPQGASFDSVNFSLLYLQVVKRIRTDVQIVQPAPLSAPGNPRQINEAYRLEETDSVRRALVSAATDFYPDRPIYTSFPIDGLISSGPETISNGVAFCLKIRMKDCGDTSFVAVEPDPNERERLSGDFLSADTLADYELAQAMFRLDSGDLPGAQSDLIQWLQLSSQVGGADFEAYVDRRGRLFGKLESNN